MPGTPVAAQVIALAHRPDLLTATPRLREDTLHRAARAVFAQVHSATTGMAERPRAFPHAAMPALAAERAAAVVVVVHVAVVVADTEAAAGTGNRSFVMFRITCQISKWRDTVCSQQS